MAAALLERYDFPLAPLQLVQILLRANVTNGRVRVESDVPLFSYGSLIVRGRAVSAEGGGHPAAAVRRAAMPRGAGGMAALKTKQRRHGRRTPSLLYPSPPCPPQSSRSRSRSRRFRRRSSRRSSGSSARPATTSFDSASGTSGT